MKISVKTKALRPFRRAGVEFGPAPLVLDTDDLGPDRTAAIRSEESLVVEDMSAARASNAMAPAAVTAESFGEVDDSGSKKKGRR